MIWLCLPGIRSRLLTIITITLKRKPANLAKFSPLQFASLDVALIRSMRAEGRVEWVTFKALHSPGIAVITAEDLHLTPAIVLRG